MNPQTKIESLAKVSQTQASSVEMQPKPISIESKNNDLDVSNQQTSLAKQNQKRPKKAKISKRANTIQPKTTKAEVKQAFDQPPSTKNVSSELVKGKTFSDFGLSEELLKSVLRLNLCKPTDIQALAIPSALEGSDILASAETGSGKTIAYLIPIIEHIAKDPNNMALVITPTRELATQVDQVIYDLLNYQRHIKTAKLIGGERIYKQHNQLRRNPKIIMGTPGRIIDHLNQGSLNLSKVNFLVFDEADRILDMGFEKQINEISSSLSQSRQTLLFSATLPNSILKLADNYQDKPKRIAIGSSNKPVANIKQETIHLSSQEKLAGLVQQISVRQGSIIIFVKTKYGTERLAKNLKQQNIKALALHGDIRHNKREQIMKSFKDSRCRVLVATDLASRGLDIPHIEHVINYDLPQCPEDFIHRIGRTARGGAKGSALSFISKEDKFKWMAIEKMIDPEAHKDVKIPKAGRGGRSRKKFSDRNSDFNSRSGFKSRPNKNSANKFTKRANKGSDYSIKANDKAYSGKKSQSKDSSQEGLKSKSFKTKGSRKESDRHNRKRRRFNRSKPQAA